MYINCNISIELYAATRSNLYVWLLIYPLSLYASPQAGSNGINTGSMKYALHESNGYNPAHYLLFAISRQKRIYPTSTVYRFKNI